MHEKQDKSIISTLVLMGATFLAITISGFITQQTFFQILPLYVSLVVALLQTRANRLGPLISSFNSILYAIVYLRYQLYSSAVYAVFFAAPIQFVTFLRWRKQPYQNSTVFRKLSLKQKGLIAGLFCVAWAVVVFLVTKANSVKSVLDTTVSLLGICSSCLMMLSFAEYAKLGVVGQTCNALLYTTMLGKNPEQLTYFIFILYSIVCGIKGTRRVNAIYRQQQAEKEETTANTI